LPGRRKSGVTLKAPFPWFGGKSRAASLVWQRFGEVRNYVEPLAHQVREWAIEQGNDPLLRIALCGYEGEHKMPPSWKCVPWKTRGGYGSQSHGLGRENSHRERIWFSPHCLKALKEKAA
jgi:hypothetical protein